MGFHIHKISRSLTSSEQVKMSDSDSDCPQFASRADLNHAVGRITEQIDSSNASCKAFILDQIKLSEERVKRFVETKLGDIYSKIEWKLDSLSNTLCSRLDDADAKAATSEEKMKEIGSTLTSVAESKQAAVAQEAPSPIAYDKLPSLTRREYVKIVKAVVANMEPEDQEKAFDFSFPLKSASADAIIVKILAGMKSGHGIPPNHLRYAIKKYYRNRYVSAT